MITSESSSKNFESMSGDIDSKTIAQSLELTNIILNAEMEACPDGILIMNNTHTKIILSNRKFIDMMGIPPELLRVGFPSAVFVKESEIMKDPKTFFTRLRYLDEHVDETHFDMLETIDKRFIERHTTPLLAPSGQNLGRVMFFHDATERVQNQDKLQFSNVLLGAEMESSPDGILVVKTDNKSIILFNRRFIEMMEISPDLAHAGVEAPVLEQVSVLMKDRKKFLDRVQYLYDHADESGFDELETIDKRFFERHTTLLHSPAGQTLGRVWFFHDITKRKQAEEKILQLAHDDALTGLANRRGFAETVHQEIARAGRSGKNFSLLYLDLDYFKDINDTRGHPVGDLLLQAVAQRLKASVRITDTVARLGGDEFAILQTDTEDPPDTSILSNKLIEAFRVPFDIEGQMIQSGASVGISIYGRDAMTADMLLSNADIALYKAKSEGRGTYRFFSEAMAAEVKTRVMMSAEFRKAIDRNELFLLYQPQVEIETGRITGIEALVRWQHPERGVVGPDMFIPMAEKNRLISILGHWVMQKACRQAKEWLDAGILPRVMAVNISSLEFKSPFELEENVLATLKESGLPPSRLELELTESGLMEASLDHVDILQRFRLLGIRVAIDDFGTGYSSLDYLRRFHKDRIKIAQNFILDIETVPEDQTIVKAILRLTQELGLDVIAEGIETEGQLRMLKNWGCKEVQGYYYSKPLAPEDLAPLLAKGCIPRRHKLAELNFGCHQQNPENSNIA